MRISDWSSDVCSSDLRALGHPDAFPADDLVLQKAVPTEPAPAKAGGTRMTAKALTARAEAWRPWRGYATLQLWREAMAAPVATTAQRAARQRSEEHTSELQSTMRISYAVLCLKKKKSRTQ